MPEEQNRQVVFLKSLHALQADLEGVVKDAKNPHFKSTYADRTDILLFVRPFLHKHGFVLTQALSTPPSHITGSVLAMTTTLHHVETGAAIGDTAIVPLPKADPQGYGSAATYTSRYGIVNLLALPLLDDDDGHAASPQKEKTAPSPFTRKPAAKPQPTVALGDDGFTTVPAPTPPPAPLPSDKAKATPSLPPEKKPVTKKLWGSK